MSSLKNRTVRFAENNIGKEKDIDECQRKLESELHKTREALKRANNES